MLGGWKVEWRLYVSDNSNNHGFYVEKKALIKMTSSHQSLFNVNQSTIALITSDFFPLMDQLFCL